MKVLLASFLTLILFSCNKNIEKPAAVINGDVVESNNGVYAEPCHATVFTTNYATLPGKVPPFRFTKTQYPSGRIRTINMLSRANPIHNAFKPQAWEVIGTFTYNLKDEAYFVGTKQLWEYYKTSTGSAARKSIVKKNMKLRFRFFTEEDYAPPVGSCNYVANELDRTDFALHLDPWEGRLTVGKSSDEPNMTFASQWPDNSDEYKLVLQSQTDENTIPTDYRLRKRITFTYLTSRSQGSYRKHSYQPTQNWISMEFTLVEVMGWLPPGFRQSSPRASVSVEFYTSPTTKIVQSQVYKNQKYDAGAKLLSYTYGDNILQKTTWVCK